MNFNHMIDHTILKADATETDVIRLCAEGEGIRLCLGLRQFEALSRSYTNSFSAAA